MRQQIRRLCGNVGENSGVLENPAASKSTLCHLVQCRLHGKWEQARDVDKVLPSQELHQQYIGVPPFIY